MKILLFCAAIYLCIPTLALEFHSERIKTMDIEILQQIISRNIRKLEVGEESPLPIIKQSLEILLARPDQGTASTTIFDQLQNLAGAEDSFTTALKSIVDDAVESFKKNSKAKEDLREQNTYVFILINMLSEIQKKKDSPNFAAIIEQIRDAEIGRAHV